jgi:hypothetical protein
MHAENQCGASNGCQKTLPGQVAASRTLQDLDREGLPTEMMSRVRQLASQAKLGEVMIMLADSLVGRAESG